MSGLPLQRARFACGYRALKCAHEVCRAVAVERMGRLRSPMCKDGSISQGRSFTLTIGVGHEFVRQAGRRAQKRGHGKIRRARVIGLGPQTNHRTVRVMAEATELLVQQPHSLCV